MSEILVQKLYNQLFQFEGKNKKAPYPIHKKLELETFGYNDIYEWIAKTYTLNLNAKILDAGCGVGYGSIFLSKQYNCNVTGISLSDEEIKRASEFTKKENIENNVKFKQQSFDALQANSFDFIIAIESVKHTLDIDKTLQSLKNALKPNGVLVIVDDFLISKNHKSVIEKYAKDWELKVLLKHSDFATDFTLKKDLTPFVITKNQFKLTIGTVILSILKPLFKIASIMRGGLYLEKLFKHNIMKYYALEFKKL